MTLGFRKVDYASMQQLQPALKSENHNFNYAITNSFIYMIEITNTVHSCNPKIKDNQKKGSSYIP